MALTAQAAHAGRQREATQRSRADFNVRAIKISCAVLLSVCFWYTVPYVLPLVIDSDPVKAAANEAQAYGGNLSRQVALPIVFAIAAWMLWRLPRRGRLSGRLLMVAAAYVGWAVASFAWSEAPSISGKRLVVFLIDAFFAVAIARVYSVLELALWGFVSTGTVALLALYADVVMTKSFAPLDANYRFMGVMTANYQAMNLLVCVLCGLTLCLRRPDWRARLLPLVGVVAVLQFLTRARIGAFLCILLGGFMLVRLARTQLNPVGRAMALLAMLTVALPGLIYFVGGKGSDAATAVFMMGRKDTENTSSLSNRAPLWAEVLDNVKERPLLGYGYEAFWSPQRVEKFSADQGWIVPHAHNTFLDQTLSLGVVGALLYAGMMLGALAESWRRYRRRGTETDLLPAMLLTWIVMISMSESAPLDPYLPSMLAYIAVVKMCLVEGSEAESDDALGPRAIVSGLPRAGATTRDLRYQTGLRGGSAA